jgi:sigma-B regulation protein RsbU (phosphoserine phosphatase)
MRSSLQKTRLRQRLRENSELKAAQEELRRRAEELDWQIEITIQQNRELMQFNHLATHTLQEPVRKMLFLSDRLTTQDNWKKTEMAVRKIRDLTTDMNEKLKGLQKYAWFSNDGFESERIAIQDLFLIAKEELETQNPELSLRIACQPLPEIEANRAQMFFLVKELLLNAVKFCRPGNLVDVKIVASQLLMNKYRQLTGKYKYIECVKFQISDDGRGFDGTYQEQAFELFRQLHSASGNGVGLSLCKKIVENHGGSIHLESEPEAGTSVVIFLPLIQKKKDLSKNQLICTTSRISLCSEQKKSVDEIQYF